MPGNPYEKLKRHCAIEATIGHMKTEGRLDRCTLKGQLGDAMFALLCAVCHNLRLILNFLRDFLAFLYTEMEKNIFKSQATEEQPCRIMVS